MKKTIMMIALLASVPAAQAADFMNWVESAVGSHHAGQEQVSLPLDYARLLTLEAGEREMYPSVSPDGKYMLVRSMQKHRSVISRRLVENGDPINVVMDGDVQAQSSTAWHGNDAVTFLSHRAGSLGLWQKPVDGGVIRRLHGRLDGALKSPIVLGDGSIIAVRMLKPLQRSSDARKKKQPLGFDQWTPAGKQAQLVRLDSKGEHVLAPGVNPALSPDGKRLVFSMQAGRSWHLFMMHVDGSELIELTEGRSVDVQPAWSPDGRWVAFTSNRAMSDMRNHKKDNWDVWMIAVDGRNLMRLTTDIAKDGAPSFGLNGRVYFHSNRNISEQDKREHQVNRNTKGFHVWSVKLPESEKLPE